jgi:hypothetical protein
VGVDDAPALLDLLSEMLAVERDRQRLYEGLVVDTPEELHAKLLEYAEQSRRSALVLDQAVRDLGGDPAYLSPGARLVDKVTDAVVEATAGTPERRRMYRALHLPARETQDRLIWEALDGLAATADARTAEILRGASTAVLSEEALGAHDADRNDERVAWILREMQIALGHELGVPIKTGRRTGLRRTPTARSPCSRASTAPSSASAATSASSPPLCSVFSPKEEALPSG